jgi:GTP-binding protein
MFKGSIRWSSSSAKNVNTGVVADFAGRYVRAVAETSKDLVVPNHLNTMSSRICYHWDTLPPTEAQLVHANRFFERERAKFLWSAPKFRSMAFGRAPEVCFIGRSNVGKSSVLNALLGAKNLAHTSANPGRTKAMNAFGVGSSSNDPLVVLDMPGYGMGGHSEWGAEIIKYLGKRQELKRAFLLIDAGHGPKPSDLAMIQLFNQHKVPFQVVLSKIDKLLASKNAKKSPSAHDFSHRIESLQKTLESTKSIVQRDIELDEGHLVGEIISCSSRPSVVGQNVGIAALRFAILRAAGLHFQPEVKLAPAVEIVPHEEIFSMQRGPNKADL